MADDGGVGAVQAAAISLGDRPLRRMSTRGSEVHGALITADTRGWCGLMGVRRERRDDAIRRLPTRSVSHCCPDLVHEPVWR
jgi:hypothetical protein